jgi:protein transport protein SEC31
LRRFNRIAWSAPDGARPRGVLAAGLESGELALFDPAQVLDAGSAEWARYFAARHVALNFAAPSPAVAPVFRNSTHTGPVRGLDFNPLQTNLLGSGAINGEVRVSLLPSARLRAAG